MLASLTQYFDKHVEHGHMLHEIIEGKTPLSLRLIDWFVTHYAKRNNVTYWLVPAGNGPAAAATAGDFVGLTERFPVEHPHAKKFSVYLEYRSQLRAFSKHVFDPFRRHNRISFVTGERTAGDAPFVIDTTVGQLNFFRWALHYRVIDYVLRNLSTIEDDMSAFQQQRRSSTQKKHAPGPHSQASAGAAATASVATAKPRTMSKKSASSAMPAAPRLLSNRILFD